MEPQVCVTCGIRNKSKCCVDIIIFIISLLLALTAGLLIGERTGQYIANRRI